ncbi:membrane protein involved in colicin uptake [Pseudomonas sp. GM18]|uniref:S-type pyocin domain-containing protein n=1 Tax=Pseudomonas sp. GM18 TaxID=1144324 RepID=UPI0002726645|nr:S-type pyocin domain-containing protein [Pseudomonas sp. GM18]EJM16823.1 membrane protein involved in colicin uptake [Pseudomonas sp. GM18]
MQKPPVFELTEAVHTTATAPPGIIPAPATSIHRPPSGQFAPQQILSQNVNKIAEAIKQVEQEYHVQSAYLSQTLEHELAATRLEGSTAPVPPVDAIIRELGVRNTLLTRKSAELQQKTALANMFYGADPLGRPLKEFYVRALMSQRHFGPDSVVIQAGLASYKAAYEARLLTQSIQMLNQQQVTVLNWLAAVQVQDQAQREAQRLAAEAARKAREAQIEAQRLAAEAEQKARDARIEAERLAAEAVRKAKEAKEREEAEEKRRAEAEARLKSLNDFFAAIDEAKASRPFPISGAAVASSPVFTLAAGRLATNPATTLAIRAALQSAVATVTAVGVASASAVLVGFAALMFPSPLGDSDQHEMLLPPMSDLVPDNLHKWSLTVDSYNSDDQHALSVPLSDLVPDSLPDLHAIALVNGDVELPVAMGTRTVGNTTEFFVAAANSVAVPSRVPVRLATFDPVLNVYRSWDPDAPSIGMTWTPIVKPAGSSTSLPASGPNVAIYNGTTVTALEGRIDSFPELDLISFGGFITVFPIESGMAPVYTMFRDRRDEPGVASGYGEAVSGVWLEFASQADGAVIPNRIADKLRGGNFSSFKAFREAFWRAVIDSPDLTKQFTANNAQEMKNGRAPFSRRKDRLGGQVKFELHHVKHISEGGEIYDIDNIRVITPKRHSEIHKGEK